MSVLAAVILRRFAAGDGWSGKVFHQADARAPLSPKGKSPSVLGAQYVTTSTGVGCNKANWVASFLEILAHVFSCLHFSKVEAHNELPHAKLSHTGSCLLR